MKETTYDEKTAALLEKSYAQLRNRDNNVLKSLEQLRKTAIRQKDDNLTGLAYYYLADAYYSFSLSYEQFRTYLNKALHHLQKAGNEEFLARTYNFIGIDACNHGCYDIAYYFFLTALRIAEQLKDSIIPGILNSNIGQIYNLLGNPRFALNYIRSSNRQLNEFTEDVYYHRSMIIGYYMEGMLCISLNDLEGARKVEKRIRKHEKLSGDAILETVRIPMKIFRTVLTLKDGDEAQVPSMLADTLDTICAEPELYEYMDDIVLLCNILFKTGHVDEVKRILDAITESVKRSNVVHLKRQLTNLKITYYEMTGDEAQEVACLKELRALLNEQESDQHRLYQYSIELINNMHELRGELKNQKD